MKKQISVTKLRENLKSCKRAKATPDFESEGQKYLFKAFVKKLMSGKPVLFGDLDYSKFDMDDIFYVSQDYDGFIEKPINFHRAVSHIEQTAQPVNFI